MKTESGPGEDWRNSYQKADECEARLEVGQVVAHMSQWGQLVGAQAVDGLVVRGEVV